MKPRSIDSAEGEMHQIKINIHDDILKMIKTGELESDDNANHSGGNVQEKHAQIEINVHSVHKTALIARPATWPLMVIDMK